MKTGYILYERNGSYHKKLIGLFEKESQAKLYAAVLQDRIKRKQSVGVKLDNAWRASLGRNFVVEELNFLDDDPLLVQYVMENTNGKEKAC